jgi:hypothetical protein
MYAFKLIYTRRNNTMHTVNHSVITLKQLEDNVKRIFKKFWKFIPHNGKKNTVYRFHGLKQPISVVRKLSFF